MPWTVGRSRATRPMYRALCMGKMPDLNSSRYIHSTDHLRLKNLTLGFTLPSEWTRKALIDKARIYFSGSNLLTWAKWKQYDPETPVNGEVFCEAPAMRTFNFGVQLTF